MFIELKKIPEGSSTETRSLLLSEALSTLGSINATIPAEIQYRRLNTLIVVEISYSATFATSCARCLKPLTQELTGETSFTVGMAEDEELASEDVDFYLYEYNQERVEFTQSLYDDVMTRIPIRVLCSESCPGFTPADSIKEKKQETSEPMELDTRWAALKKLNTKD